jgi:hypothetical protein
MDSNKRVTLLQKLGNMKRKIVLPRPLKIGSQYFSKRPFSLGVLVVSIIISIGAIGYVWQFYSYDNPATVIRFSQYSNDCVRISDGSFILTYDDNGKQTLRLNVNITCEGESLHGKTVHFYVSSNLKLVKGDSSDTINQYREFYSFTFPEAGNQSSFTANFEGNLFGANKSQVNLDLSILSDYLPQPIPFKIIISRTTNLDITEIFPEPNERYSYGMVYENQIIKDINNGINIKISGVDRPGTNQNQLLVLLIGLGLGVVFSLITTIVYDVTRFVDEVKPVRMNQPFNRFRKNLSGSLKFRKHPLLNSKTQPKKLLKNRRSAQNDK